MAPEQTTTKESNISEAATTPSKEVSPIPANTVDANTSTVSVDSTNGEHDPFYEPVVSLPEVATKTNEEDEEVLYKERCKLFRYASDTSEWKERGTGNVKLLKNGKKGTVRVLMRQEKTLKVRANHYLTPYTRLRPSAGSDRAFVWYVMLDFADEEATSETFAIRFANADIARTFKEALEDGVLYVTTTKAGLDLSGDEESEEEGDEEKENEPVEENKKESDPDITVSEKEVVSSMQKLKVEDEIKSQPEAAEQKTAEGTS